MLCSTHRVEEIMKNLRNIFSKVMPVILVILMVMSSNILVMAASDNALDSEDNLSDIICGDYTYQLSGDRAVITGYRGTDTSIFIPDNVDGYTVEKIGSYAFENYSSLISVTIPDSVTIIEDAAFLGCSNLTDIAIPDSVTTIKSAVFSYCTSLKAITLPNKLKQIDNSLFNGCSSLSSIIIPDGVTHIYGSAFKECSSLTSAVIPDSVTNIGWEVFSKCSSLKAVKIPANVATIGDSVFDNCSSIENITVDDKNTVYNSQDNCNAIIKTDNNELILGCSNTKIPDSVTTIGNSAFSGCSNLADIKIPDSVTTIKSTAFEGCSSLKSIMIPKNVTNIQSYIFYKCNNLINMEVDSKNIVYDSRSNCNAIIKTGSNELVAGCKKTIIPDTVESIGRNAFQDNINITAMKIPDSVKTIGMAAFYGCSNLSDIVISDGVETIDYAAFYECSSLKDITLPSSVTRLEDEVFYGCSDLKNIIILNNEIEIGDDVFSGCKNLTIHASKKSNAYTYAINHTILYSFINESIEIEKKEQSITGTKLYNKATTDKSFKLDAKIKTGDGRLTYASSNKSVATVADDGYVTIKKSGQTSIKISASETTNYKKCEFTVTLKVMKANSNSKVGKTFTDSKSKSVCKITTAGKTVEYIKPLDKNTTKITIPATVTYSNIKYSVTSIAPNAFKECKKLTTVKIGKNIITIGQKAFYKCVSLKKITIPSNVKNIKKQAFAGCGKLKNIIIKTKKLTIKTVGSNAFKSIHPKAIITVPSSKKTAYIKILKARGVRV